MNYETARETCCCGAELVTSKNYTGDFAKFREAHRICREQIAKVTRSSGTEAEAEAQQPKRRPSTEDA